MKAVKLLLGLTSFVLEAASNSSCGVDNSPIKVVFEGVATIETYPWLGYLFYPTAKDLLTTVVVLVTKQIVLGTATDIDKLPKHDFRERARVVLGTNCSPKHSLKIKDYNFHPDYGTSTHSALVLIQLDTENLDVGTLRPICPPPIHILEPEFYAMTLSRDCDKPKVKLFEMKYVDSSQCRTYYRKSGLDIDSIWPTHTACAQAKHGGECVWRSGTALALYQGNRWYLMGFGVYGPGCEAPARFLDYGMYHKWVRTSISRIGRPTITRLGENEVILRRSLSNLQRYGPCDLGELKEELYTDQTIISTKKAGLRKVRYNMTIYSTVEYHCVVFKATPFDSHNKPKLRLRRWCAGTLALCSDFHTLEIDFYVEIEFTGKVTYDLKAYGRMARTIDPRRAMAYVNSWLVSSREPQSDENLRMSEDKDYLREDSGEPNESYWPVGWHHVGERGLRGRRGFAVLDDDVILETTTTRDTL